MTQPNITYVVHLISLFMHASRTSHLLGIKRIFKYLQGNANYGLWLLPSCTVTIVAYSDVDSTGCRDNPRSTTGYVVFVSNNLIYYHSKKQPNVSKSSTAVEYRVVA